MKLRKRKRKRKESSRKGFRRKDASRISGERELLQQPDKVRKEEEMPTQITGEKEVSEVKTARRKERKNSKFSCLEDHLRYMRERMF